MSTLSPDYTPRAKPELLQSDVAHGILRTVRQVQRMLEDDILWLWRQIEVARLEGRSYEAAEDADLDEILKIEEAMAFLDVAREHALDGLVDILCS